jgi:4-aminobutyrate aminotransferase-like enzyme
MFCFEHYDVVPNLLCLGKGISSSVPVSALVGESKALDTLPPGSLSSTHGGNAFSCRVALANIEALEEDRLVDKAAKVGARMKERLEQMCDKFECAGDARGLGLAWALELVKSKKTKEPDAALAKQIVDQCARKGLLMIAPIGIYGNILRISPPLCITREEVDAGCDILQSALPT